jgi:hypothetical protein
MCTLTYHDGFLTLHIDVYATNKTGSSSDDWIYDQLVAHSFINYTYTMAVQFYVSHLHTLQSTAAHALGFSVSTSRLPATDLYTQTVAVLTLQILHVNLHNSRR